MRILQFIKRCFKSFFIWIWSLTAEKIGAMLSGIGTLLIGVGALLALSRTEDLLEKVLQIGEQAAQTAKMTDRVAQQNELANSKLDSLNEISSIMLNILKKDAVQTITEANPILKNPNANKNDFEIILKSIPETGPEGQIILPRNLRSEAVASLTKEEDPSKREQILYKFLMVAPPENK